MLWVLLIVLLLLAVGGLPTWPYAAAWGTGYWPSGVLALLFLIVLIAVLTNGSIFSRGRGPLV